MRITDPLEHGCWEPLKIGWHAMMLVGAIGCAIYNVSAFVHRKQLHNAVNGCLYSALIWLEIEHVAHHLEELDRHTP